jgi:DNA-binding MarR family transcriptional regulator
MLKSHAPNVLQVVLENPGLTQDQIATRSGVQKTHLSGMLRHMETGGLVERRREGRRVHVTARPGAETALAPTLRA